MRFSFVVTFMLFLFPLAGVHADGVESLETIRQQQVNIRVEAEARRGVYENLTDAQRQQLFAIQDRVNALIADKESSGDLGEQQRLRLFNDLESIEALVNQAEDQRMVCRRVSTIGTHRKERVCKTVAQRREEMREAQQMLNRSSNCSGDLCNGGG